jgi:hypothetical protein
MSARRRFAHAPTIAAILAVPACQRADREAGPSATATAAPPPMTAAPAASASGPTDPGPDTVDDEPAPEDGSVAEASCAPPDPNLTPLLLLRFAFTSGIDGRDPRDKLSVARPGQRIFSHFTVRNKSGRERCIRIELVVGREKRTTLTLKIGESWSWRTWGYNTLRSDDTGTLVAIVRDDQGNELARRELSIVPEHLSR